MRKLYNLGLLNIALLFSVSVYAQKELKKANRLYDKLDYALAIPHYLEYFKNHEPDAMSAERIADCYRLNNNIREAEIWYAKAVNLSPDNSRTRLYYAEALKSNGKYDEAKEQYFAYGEINSAASQQVAKAIRLCEEAMEWIASPAPYEIENVQALNSEGADFCPLMVDNGILFSSDRIEKDKKYTEENIHGWSGRPYVKLYFAELQNTPLGKDAVTGKTGGPSSGNEIPSESVWKEASALPPTINGEFHTGPAVFDAKNNLLFFTRTRKVKINVGERYPDPTSWLGGLAMGKRYINRLEIYTVEKKDTSWANINSFQYNNAENYSIGHPALSPDGKVLYFSSDMPGGYGETDIWYCELDNDGKWKKPMNAGTVINTSGRESFPVVSNDGTLFFSSDGHPGLGGLDLFKARGAANNWSEVTNMRVPLNSPKDDLSIIFAKNDEEGYFSSDREGGKGMDDIYSFKVIRPTAPPPVIPAQVKLVFPTVYFDFNKANIRSDATTGLAQVITTLNEHPGITVEVRAHCDCRGSDVYNMTLSNKRAQSAVDYLVINGIDKGRLIPQAYGESQPANGCVDGIQCSEEDHQQNRRTEFKVMEEMKPLKD